MKSYGLTNKVLVPNRGILRRFAYRSIRSHYLLAPCFINMTTHGHRNACGTESHTSREELSPFQSLHCNIEFAGALRFRKFDAGLGTFFLSVLTRI